MIDIGIIILCIVVGVSCWVYDGRPERVALANTNYDNDDDWGTR